MLNLYCDESHDRHTYALAGWLAVPGAKQDYGWDGFTASWRRMLSTIKMPDGSPCPAFHAAEICHRRRIKGSRFKGWKRHQEREAFDKAVNVIVDRNVCGNMLPIGSSMAVPTDALSWMPEGVDRTIWMLLFVHLFHMLLTKYHPQNGISLMFDEKPEVQAIVNEHYTEAKKVIDRLLPGKLPSTVVAFGNDEEHPPLQAADLFAYEWRKQITDKRLKPSAKRREHYGRMRDGRPINTQLHHFNAEAMRTIKASVPAGQSLTGAMLACPTTED